ncbi:MBL fold metallo-hydrolase [Solwaraspora sp. WMMD791]|uniref:MBL fold metallo-hydrolase n=1 Tax=Solwaraspora sp. WMMD791 TaxID=3016086 RepID=UPI00249CB85B|nr:MBL fold metallo-hydrolase [Solwaraspora sp. WMMD791]WFE27850.1 MBL fold metallo-hydrolase [Solwaraspora sp. WMMD791]
MKVHHLNCGTMRLPAAPLVCHVLLVETDNGLVLVDTGHGLDDISSPGRRIGPARWVVRPVLDPDETAARQVERLGLRRDDVRHIVVTHFDADHIGGLSDFPHATVHTTADEVLGALTPPTSRERRRFRPAQWAYGPRIVEHGATGEPWRGFAAAKPLDEIAPGIVLIPLPGHTRGHACVAVDTGDRWLLHAGDAFYHPGSIDGHGGVPFALRALETLIAYDRVRVRDNHARLADLRSRADPDLTIFSAHDPVAFAQLSAGAAPRRGGRDGGRPGRR